MSDTAWTALRQTLVQRYDELKLRLALSLGSRELADDALHEAYLRLHRCDATAAIQQPESYILKVALNIASDQRRSDRRRASQAEVLAVVGVAGDRARDLSQEIEARSEVELLKRALAELTPRRRAILIAARLDGMPHDAIAKRFGISRTMVQKELRRAVVDCARALGRAGTGGGDT